MQALITGINGFVGGHLAEYLLDVGGWDIWGVDLGNAIRLPHLRDKVHFTTANLCDAAGVSEMIRQVQPQVIFHLAGQPFVPESFQDPAATLNTNIVAQLNIFLALIEHSIQARVLTISSAEVYGLIRAEDIPIDEDTPLRPSSPYAVSKIAQDMLALQYHLSHKLDVVRIRPFNHIGPRQGDRFVTASFAKQVAYIEQGMQAPVIRVGNLNAERDFTDVRDMVRAYVHAAQYAESGQVYNIGSGHPVKIQTVLDTVLAASSTPIEVTQDPQRMRPVDIPKLVCDATRFRTCTGWEPQYTLEQTLKDIVEDWRTRVRHEKEKA